MRVLRIAQYFKCATATQHAPHRVHNGFVFSAFEIPHATFEILFGNKTK